MGIFDMLSPLMDPITILGAASSAVGIASFGIQLAQVLSKFISDVSSAGQTLHAVLESIKSASATMKHINGFLEEECRNLKKGNKPSLFRSEAISDIQSTTDQCLKIFWRVEAWVVSRDDSQELETKLTNRLDEFKNQLKSSKNTQVPIINLDKSLLKARKLSKRDRLQWPFSAPKLEQYNAQLHRLEAHLTLMFQVITVCALQRKPGIGHAEINSIYEIYAVIPQTAADSEISGIRLELSKQKHSGRSKSAKIADDDAKSRLSSRFAPVDIKTNDDVYDHPPWYGVPVQNPSEPTHTRMTRRGRGPQTSTDSYNPPSVGTRVDKIHRATSRRKFSNATDRDSILQDDSAAIGSIFSSVAKTDAALKHIAHDTAKAKKTSEAETSNQKDGTSFPGSFLESHFDTKIPADTENSSMVAQRSTKSATTADGRTTEQIESRRKPSVRIRDVPESYRDHVNKSTSTEEELFSDINPKTHTKAHTNNISPKEDFAEDHTSLPNSQIHQQKEVESKVETEPRNDNTQNKQIHITLSPSPAPHRLDTNITHPVNALEDNLVNSSLGKDSMNMHSALLKPNSSVYIEKEQVASLSYTEPSSFASSDIGASMFELKIKNGIRKLFQRDHFTTEDMEQMFSTGCFITAFLVKGKHYHQIPSAGHFRLRKAQLEAIISKGPGPNWWKDFCFLEPDEILSINEILKPRNGLRKTIVRLKQMRKIRFRLWSQPRKALVIIIINEHSGGLGLLSKTSQTKLFDGSKHHVENLVSAESEVNLQYAVYTVHPRTGEDWLWAHITPQSFPKTEIVRRISELNNRGDSVNVKKAALQRLQQEQIGIIINAKNETDHSCAWTLAQLDVLYQDYTPASEPPVIRSITVYLVGETHPVKASAESHGQNAGPSISRNEPAVTFAETDSQVRNRERKDERSKVEWEHSPGRPDRDSRSGPSTNMFGNSNANLFEKPSSNLFGNANANLFGNSNYNTGLFSNPPMSSQIPYAAPQPSRYSSDHDGSSRPHGYSQYPTQSQYSQGYIPSLYTAPPRVSGNSEFESTDPADPRYINPFEPTPNNPSKLNPKKSFHSNGNYPYGLYAYNSFQPSRYYEQSWVAPSARPPPPSVPASETSSSQPMYVEHERRSRVPYPEYFDDRSFDPHTPDYEDGKDIVRQLLLKWTPAGDEQNEEIDTTGVQSKAGRYSQSSDESWEALDMDDTKDPFLASEAHSVYAHTSENPLTASVLKQARKKVRLAETAESDDEISNPPTTKLPRDLESRSMVSGWSYAEPEIDQKKRKRKGKHLKLESEPEPEPATPHSAIIEDRYSWVPWDAKMKTKKKKDKTELQGFDIPDVKGGKDLAIDEDEDWSWDFGKSKPMMKKKNKATVEEETGPNPEKPLDNNIANGNQQEDISPELKVEHPEPINDENLHGAEQQKENNTAPTTSAYEKANTTDQEEVPHLETLESLFAATTLEKEDFITDPSISIISLNGPTEIIPGPTAKSSENNPQAQRKKRVRLMAKPMYMEDANEGSGKPLVGTRRSATTNF